MTSSYESGLLYPTIAHAASDHARRTPDAVAFELIQNSSSRVRVSYGELDLQARSVAAFLRSRVRKGDRVLLPTNNELSFHAAFLGCMYAGCIAVPVQVPQRKPKLPDLGLGRFLSIIQNSGANMVLVDEVHLPTLGNADAQASAYFDGAAVESVQTAMQHAVSPGLHLELPEPDQIAFLQYTSGSTSQPRGVVLTHDCIVRNQRSIHQCCRLSKQDTVVSWLPLYHDMGLCSGFFMPLYLGVLSIVLPPLLFIAKPQLWLREIGRHPSVVSGGPNFAYAHCTSRIADDVLATLDLRNWRLAYCGAEPIRPETIAAFCDKFEATGFDRNAFCPSYGLAEGTLFVSAKPDGEQPHVLTLSQQALAANRMVQVDGLYTGKSIQLMGCGRAGTGISIAVIDPATRCTLPDGEIGEIAVCSDSAGLGYWGNLESSAQTFNIAIHGTHGKRHFLTGDLGFMLEGQLYISGRKKDVIIVNGVNHYPQDIEFTAQRQHQAFCGYRASAFSVAQSQGQGQKLVLLMEVHAKKLQGDHQQIAGDIKQAVRLEHQLSIEEIIFVAPGGIPKTSSGKVQRSECSALYRQKHFAKSTELSCETGGN